MHDFKYRHDELHCERLKVAQAAERFGTPLFLYSQNTIRDHFLKIKRAFRSINPLICYSMKANSNLAVCKVLLKLGAGLDIVSGGELYKAIQLGASPRKIVYAGVGKKSDEISSALTAGILCFNVESLAELKMIDRIALRQHASATISLRVNPGVDVQAHEYITTGSAIDKFGIPIAEIEKITRSIRQFKQLKLAGLHLHIGSQITQSRPFIQAVSKIIPLIRYLKLSGVSLKWLNIGGGLGIVYKDEKPQTASVFANKIIPLLKKTGLKIILEPGRFIVGNAGILLTRVLYIKKSGVKNFVVVDAAMNDLIRPALYKAYHEILPVKRVRRSAKKMYDIVGPICESGDFLARDRRLPTVQVGDLLAIMGAGAYGFSMSSNYNARPRACEAMASDDKAYLIRRRETYRDLIKGEVY